MIVFCHLLNDNSGSPVVLKSVIEALSPVDANLVLLVGSQGQGCLDTAGIPIRRYWYHRSRFRFITLFTYLFSQASLYRALNRADLPADAVIYVNTLLPFGAALWGRRNGRTVIYHVHEVSITPGLMRRFLTRIVEKCAQHAFYVSEDQRKRLPIVDVPSTVLPNPVTPEIAKNGLDTPYSPRRSGVFEVLMLASPRDFKGVPEYLDLARRLIRREDVRFTLVLNAVEHEIVTYLPAGCRPANVSIHSRTDTPELFYATADVVVNLSRVDRWVETFGMTIVEGMAFGLPVIAPPVGGPVEIVTDGREGYLVDSRDEFSLEERLLSLIDDRANAMSMSKAARRRAQDFSMDRFADTLRLRIYHS
jgi:glycosyltransferase involved in cell wall biosynthesis